MCVNVYGGSTNNFLSFRFLPQETWNWNPKLHFTWDKHDITTPNQTCKVVGDDTVWGAKEQTCKKGIDSKKLIFFVFIHHLRVQRQIPSFGLSNICA
jgi:hypothetical protein